jgi:hypothetical protein
VLGSEVRAGERVTVDCDDTGRIMFSVSVRAPDTHTNNV